MTDAIFVIEMEEVLVARMQFSGESASISANIFSFKSKFSVAASTMRSAFETAFFSSVKVVMLPSVIAFSSSVRFPLAIILSRFVVMVLIALSRFSCSRPPNLFGIHFEQKYGQFHFP